MMTEEQLKASILQMAMQGKLVEQKKQEESVRLKKVKIKKTDDLAFDIPEKWITAHIENITESVASKQYQIKESEVKTSGKHIVISQSQEYSIGFSDDTNKLYHHDAPVIVFGDHTTIVKIVDFDFIVGADGVKLFAPDLAVLDPKFFFWEMQYYTRGLNKIGGYSRHYKFIKDKPFVVPPLEEQKRIVAKIEELMPFVEQYAKASTRLNTLNASFPDQMKKSILQQAVMGKLVPQDPSDEPVSVLLKKIADEKQKLIKEGKIKKQTSDYSYSEEDIPFDIPSTWAWARLGSICHNLRYGTSSKSSPVGDVIVLRMGNIQNGEIDYSDLVYSSNQVDNEKYWLEPMDILFNRTNSRELVGKTGLYRGEHPAIFAGYLVQVRPILVNPEYLNFVMNSEYERNYCKDVKSDGINQANVNATKIGHFLIPIPPINEQRRIVERLNRILPAVAIYKAKMEKMTQ